MILSSGVLRTSTLPLVCNIFAVDLAALEARSALGSRVIAMAKYDAKPCFLISIVTLGPELFPHVRFPGGRDYFCTVLTLWLS